jgi:hypothetical protein
MGALDLPVEDLSHSPSFDPYARGNGGRSQALGVESLRRMGGAERGRPVRWFALWVVPATSLSPEGLHTIGSPAGRARARRGGIGRGRSGQTWDGRNPHGAISLVRAPSPDLKGKVWSIGSA